MRQAAELLHEECVARQQVDEFFNGEDVDLDEVVIEELFPDDILRDDSDDYD